MSKLIQKINVKLCIILTIITIGLFGLINFTAVGAIRLKNIVPSAEILDFEYGFSLTRAYDVLNNLGELGRYFYRGMLIKYDFIFPLFYGMCAASWIALLIKKSQKLNLNFLIAFPVLAMLADWLENVGILILLNNFPKLQQWTVSLASTSGLVKWIASALSIIIIFLFIIYSLYKTYKQKKAQ